MRARTWVRAVVVAAVLATVSATPAQARELPVAHFVVLGDEGGPLAGVEAAVRARGGRVVRSWPQIGVVVAASPDAGFAAALRRDPAVDGAGASRDLVELNPGAARAAVPRTIEAIEAIEPARPAPSARADGVEPLEPRQWALRTVRADRAHQVSTGNPDVLVGVLDSGIDATHPDLAANVAAESSVGCADEGVPDTSPAAWAPTGSTHGTHVAGTIAAARNGIGVAGVAPDVRLASVKVVDDDGFIYPEYAICGFVWAAEHGMDVTNNSYYVDPWYLWCRDDPDQRAVVEAVRRAVDYATDHDVVHVAALGNSNWDMSHDILDTVSPSNGPTVVRETGPECLDLPAELPDVVGVSSVGVAEVKSYFSNYGITETDVTAPGGDNSQVPETPDGNGRILSTVPGGGYGYAQGTSMASPHAAGVVALIRGAHPEWRADRVRAELRADADRLPCPDDYDPGGHGSWLAVCEGGGTGRGFYGAGLVDALDAVTR